MGRLGLDPEVIEFDNNRKLAKLRLATNESYKNDKGEKITETQWHQLIMWGHTAEVAEKYLKKGKEIAIEGRLMNRTYTGKDGEKKYTTEVVVNSLLMVGKKEEA